MSGDCVRFLSSQTGIRESSANNTVVRAIRAIKSRIVHEQAQSIMFRDFYKTKLFWGKFRKTSRISANILRKVRSIHIICYANYREHEQFMNFGNSSRIISHKTKRTVMNTGYPNSSRTLFEQLFADRISRTQTPGGFNYIQYGR